MSLPKRIYDLGRDVASCNLVKTRTSSAENMLELQNLLNQSWPVDAAEEAQRDLTRGMYYGNPIGFLQYISEAKNRVRSLILWTESKRIARFFNLNGLVHISWNEETHSYSVVPHVPRTERPDAVQDTQDNKDNKDETDTTITVVHHAGNNPNQNNNTQDPSTGFTPVQHRRGPRQERQERRAQYKVDKRTQETQVKQFVEGSGPLPTRVRGVKSMRVLAGIDHGQKLTREDRLAMKQAKHQVRLARQAQQKETRALRQNQGQHQPQVQNQVQVVPGTYAAAVVNGASSQVSQAAPMQHLDLTQGQTQAQGQADKQSWADMSE